jgi:hypothetical protein
MARLLWTGLALAQALPGALALPSGSPLPILSVSAEAWSALNASVSGRLHAARPAGLPCFTEYKNATILTSNPGNEAECAEEKEETTISTDIISKFGSYHNPVFGTCIATGERCTVSTTYPEGVVDETCHLGMIPDYYVDAVEVEDVQSALLFAKQHGLQVTVKNTGHDYKGRSAGPNTLSIWIRHFYHDPIFHDDFVPQGCDAGVGIAATLGAAQTSMDLYEKLRGTGYLIPGGACATTGVSGGWLAGGGHSILTPTMGMGVDNVQEIEVVLPNGDHIFANRCQNQDIFFALRGGSGGTFGVVVGTTFRLYEDQEIIHAYLAVNVPGDQREVSELLVSNAEKWADEGWGGVLGVQEEGAFILTLVNPKLTLEEAEESLAPLVAYLETIATEENPLTNVIEVLPNQYAAQTTEELTALLVTEAGVSLTRSSRLLPRSLFQTEEGQSSIVDILITRPWLTLLVAPVGYELPESDKPGGPGYASITPAWREAIWHFLYLAAWDPADPEANSPETLTEVFTDISHAMDPMRALTPGSGAYQSESDVFEPNHIDSFWGRENYERLLQIKNDVDPDNMMTCWTCVGWDKDAPRYNCYPDIRDDFGQE